MEFSGTLNFEEIECPFEYGDGLLNFDVNDSNLFKKYFKFEGPIHLESEVLAGKISGTNKTIHFYINADNCGFSFQQGMLTNFKITTSVISYAVVENEFVCNHVKVTFENKKFAKWLGIFKQDDFINIKETNGMIESNYKINLNSTKSTSEFEFRGYSIKFSAGYRLAGSINVNVFPTLDFEITKEPRFTEGFPDIKPITLEDLTALIFDFIKFLKFSFQTDNVEPGGISIAFQTYNHQKEITWLKICNLYLPGIKHTMYEPNLNKTTDNPFIPWSYIIKNANKIFDFIQNDDIALYHLPENIDLRHMHSRKTISQDFSAFEFEFKQLFSGFKSQEYETEDFKECNKQLKKVSRNFAHNGNIQQRINNLISNFNNPPLREKLSFASSEFSNLLKPFLGNKQIDKIIEIILKMRNPITHGDVGVVLDTETANSFFYLRLLILSMQLKRVGFGDQEIKKSIKNIFEIL